jgi:hypothetical protein
MSHDHNSTMYVKFFLNLIDWIERVQDKMFLLWYQYHGFKELEKKV